MWSSPRQIAAVVYTECVGKKSSVGRKSSEPQKVGSGSHLQSFHLTHELAAQRQEGPGQIESKDEKTLSLCHVGKTLSNIAGFSLA